MGRIWGRGVAEDSELLEALMAAATGYGGRMRDGPTDLWPEFLRKLAQAIGAEGLSLLCAPLEGLAQIWTFGTGATLPDPQDMSRMRLDRVYSQIDLPGLGAEQAPLRALRSALPTGGHAVIVATRQGRDFRAVDGARLSSLGRFLALALAQWRALGFERGHAALDAQAARALALGWVILSTTGRALAAAPWLAAAMDESGAVRLRADGTLAFADADMAQSVARAASQALETGARHFARSPAVSIAVEPQDHQGAPALLLWLRWPRPLRDLPPETLAAAFQISRSEARLAACLADGLGLEAAAQHLGWTLETTRSASKQIFARMGVHGQPGVVRELLLSAPLS